MKLSAAKALQEVEAKESDVLKNIKFVELLEKLKSHRSEIQHRSAAVITMEADLKFKNTAKSLREFLLLRKEEYEKEKKALHVIMEEEVQDRIAAAAATTTTTTTQKPEQDPLTLGPDGSTTPQVAALLHIRLVFLYICLHTVSLAIIPGSNGIPSCRLLVALYPLNLYCHLYRVLRTGRLI